MVCKVQYPASTFKVTIQEISRNPLLTIPPSVSVQYDFDGQKTHSSISLLLMGELAILGGGLFEWFIWLANPLYFVGLFLFYKTQKKSIYFSAAATILSLSFPT